MSDYLDAIAQFLQREDDFLLYTPDAVPPGPTHAGRPAMVLRFTDGTYGTLAEAVAMREDPTPTRRTLAGLVVPAAVGTWTTTALEPPIPLEDQATIVCLLTEADAWVWLGDQVRQLTGRYPDDLRDVRLAYLDDPTALGEYAARAAAGAGRRIDRIIVIAGRLARIGCTTGEG